MTAPWHTDPYRWLDAADYDDTRSVPALVAAHLTDRSVTRPAEVTTYLRGVGAAIHRVPLTRAQGAALLLEVEALTVWNMTATRYIAMKRGISQRAAQRLLQRAKVRESGTMFASPNTTGLDVYTPGAGTGYNPPTISESEIRQMMTRTPRPCPGGSEHCTHRTRDGRRALCWHCYQHYGVQGEWPDWLAETVNAVRRAHRRDAIAALCEVRLTELD